MKLKEFLKDHFDDYVYIKRSDGSGVPVLELSTGRAINRKPNQYDDIQDIQDMSDDEQSKLQELMKGFAV